MGVSGLLPVLKSISHRVHVSRYSGEKVAVDAYSWLHKGAYSCSRELCEGIPTHKCVNYCMQRINLLRENGVSPVVIFDGGRLPMKQEEESARQRSRKDNLQSARAFAASGNTSAACECYQRAVDISPSIAKQFIEALKAEGVEYIVAPYEADAQMTYLAINGHVHAVITEDSDMLPYGCPRVLFKLDKAGDGQEICLENLGSNQGLSFVGFTLQMFLEMCIMAGCDFLKAPNGIGMKKAHQYMRKYRSFYKACKGMRFGAVTMPNGYEAAFQRAIWTFQHQRVYDAATQQLVHLRPLPAGGLVGPPGLPDPLSNEYADLSFLGASISNKLARQIATGDIDPMTHKPYPMDFEEDALKVLVGSRHVTKRRSGCSDRQNESNAPGQKLLSAFFNRAQAGYGQTPHSVSSHCHRSEMPEAAKREVKLGPRNQVESGSQGLPSRFLPTVIGSLGSQTSLAKQPDGLSQEPAARMPRDGVCQQEICQLGQVSSSGMSALSQRDIDEVIMERAELQPKQCSYGIQDEHSISLLEVDNQMLQRLSGSLMEDMAYPSSAGQPKVNASGRIIGHILMDGLDASADSLEREQARLFGGDTIAAASLELIQPYESDSLARGSLHDVTREACQGASNECVTGSMSDFEEELGELKQAADRLQGAHMYEIEGRVNQIELPPSTCSPAIDHEVDEPEALLSSPANNLLETAAPHKQITVLSTDARSILATEASERRPLTAIQQPYHHEQEPISNTKKRKISQFFKKSAKKSCVSDENVPLLDADETCRPGLSCQGDEAIGHEVNCGPFHGLSHIPRYSMLAFQAVKSAAAKRGIHGDSHGSNLAPGNELRKPFKAPRNALNNLDSCKLQPPKGKRKLGSFSEFQFRS